MQSTSTKQSSDEYTQWLAAAAAADAGTAWGFASLAGVIITLGIAFTLLF